MRDVDWALDRLEWMREERIWPNGHRYLWTDAFGVVLLASLHRLTGNRSYLDEAEHVVAEVDRVLGRRHGYRIGEAEDRDGQYFHYLAMWLFALAALGRHDRAVRIAQEVHRRFVVPGVGVHWKMREDLRGPYPGFGLGAIDPFHGWVVYRLLDERALAGEIAEMAGLIESSYSRLMITQDLGLGMMLWLSSFFPTSHGRSSIASGR
jgi:hypothetical protein